MLTKKFGNSGPYIYNGQQIDMYSLSTWLAKYNRRTKQKIYPSQVTEKHIKLFLEEELS